MLSSFPPLPGGSIVKRERSENVETIARVLKRDGYASVFLYGGRGVFDGMRFFAVKVTLGPAVRLGETDVRRQSAEIRKRAGTASKTKNKELSKSSESI